MPSHGSHVVREKNARLRRCPSENLRIGLAATACLADADNVHFTQSPPQGAHDIVVEIFRRPRSESLPRGAPRQQARPKGPRVEESIDFLAGGGRKGIDKIELT